MLKRTSNKLGAVAGLLTLLGLGTQADAASQGANLTVRVSLAAACKITGNDQTMDFGTYTPYQTGAVTPGAATITFQCARGLNSPYMSLNTVGSTVTAFASSASSTPGRIMGLDYNLTMAGNPVTSLTAGGGGTQGIAVISGSMASGQAGDVTGTATAAHTVYMNY
jgi:hypothetical protein